MSTQPGSTISQNSLPCILWLMVRYQIPPAKYPQHQSRRQRETDQGSGACSWVLVYFPTLSFNFHLPFLMANPRTSNMKTTALQRLPNQFSLLNKVRSLQQSFNMCLCLYTGISHHGLALLIEPCLMKELEAGWWPVFRMTLNGWSSLVGAHTLGQSSLIMSRN